MNNSNIRQTPIQGADALEARFALRVAARLNEQAQGVPADISERLRVAREQALVRARAARSAERQAAPAVVQLTGSGTAVFGAGGSPWWVRIASVLPVIALVLGLILIEQWHSQSQIDAAAEIDAALLSDDLPPDAYSDSGFAEFLKVPRD